MNKENTFSLQGLLEWVNKCTKSISFTVTLFLAVSISYAQNYPIQVVSQIIPPYPVYLSDYASPINENFQVNIYVNDINLVNYKAKLHLTITGQGISIETDPNYLPPPLMLQGGVPEVLTNSSLTGYFDPNNLIFKGINKYDFLRTGKLPEGLYQFSFKVVDYNRNYVVSSIGNATAWLVLNDPPMLNLPIENQKLITFEPQNVIFQWTPRHTGSPNSAFSTEYVFKLYEVWNENIDKNAIVQSSQPIYEKVISQSRLVYGIAEPALIMGKKYIYTVQARDVAGMSLFKNDGFSEARMFIYGDGCQPPAEIEAQGIDGDGISVKWGSKKGETEYEIKYRRKSTEDQNWLYDKTFTNGINVYELQANEEYEYQVRSICGSYESEFSEVQVVTIPKVEEEEFSCNPNAGKITVENTNPKSSLAVGDKIIAGGFTAKVTEISGSNGTFSGKCLVEVPFLKFVKIQHTFENIKINELNEVYEGELKSVYDESQGFVATIDRTKVPESLTQDVVITPEGRRPVPTGEVLGVNNVAEITDSITNIYVNNAGNVVVETADGNSTVIPADNNKKILVEDDSGQEFLVEGGQVMEANQAVAGATSSSTGGTGTGDGAETVEDVDKALNETPIILFSASNDQKYGFDELKYDVLRDDLSRTTIHKEEYIIPWKSVETGNTDVVEATLPVTGKYKQSNIIFKSLTAQLPVMPTMNDDKKNITVTGSFDGSEETITAKYSVKDTGDNVFQEDLGKIRVKTYDKVVHKLVIVPVNNVSYPFNVTSLKTKLNTIYNQAVVNWEVSLTNKLDVNWDIDNNGMFQDGGTGFASNYTDEMNEVISAYKDAQGRDNETYYLFMVEKPANGRVGFMPLKRQWGFIFIDQLGSDEDKAASIVAHELAHGAFRLYHTFSENNDYQVAQGTTDNLMDYTKGSHLHKYQWDFIHDPENMIFAFMQDEDEGALISENKIQEMARFINYIKCAKSKGLPTIELHHGWRLYEVKVGSLINYLDYSNRGSIISDELNDAKLTAYISHGYGSDPDDFYFGYKDIVLNVNQVEYTEASKLHIKADKGGMIFSTPIGTDKKVSKQVFDWLRKECGFDGSQPTPLQVNYNTTLKAEDIFLFSICEFEQIDKNNREKLIKELLTKQDDWLNRNQDTYQYLVINILKTIPTKDKAFFYNLFKDNPKWLSQFYKNMAPAQREKMMKVLIELWYFINNDQEKLKTETIFSYTFTESIFNNIDSKLKFSEQGKIIFTKKEVTMVSTPTAGAVASRSDKPIFETNPFEPVYIGRQGDLSEKPFIILPAFCLKYGADKGNLENLKDAAWLTVNVALFAVGIGEVAAGIKGAISASRATGIVSRQFLKATLRLSMGLGDLATMVGNSYCNLDNNMQTEFCKAWAEVEVWVSMGLLTTSVADILYTKISKSYTKKVKEGLGENADVIERELGIKVATKIDDAIRVEHKVDGLYESIIINKDEFPSGFDIIDEFEQDGGMIYMSTQISETGNSSKASFYRVYDADEKMLTFASAFMNEVKPWINDVSIPLVKGKGVPTQAYVTMRQMKLMGIKAGSLNKAKLSTVVRTETCLWISSIMKKNKYSKLSQIGNEIIDCPGIDYVKTVLTQSGHSISKGYVVSNSNPISIGTAMSRDSEITEELLKKYNLNKTDEFYSSFDINLDL